MAETDTAQSDTIVHSEGLSKGMFRMLGVEGTMDKLRDTRNNISPLVEATEEGESTGNISIQYAPLEDGSINLDQFFKSGIDDVSLVLRVSLTDTMFTDTQRDLTMAITPQGRIYVEFTNEDAVDILPGNILPIAYDNGENALRKGSILIPIITQHFEEGMTGFEVATLLRSECVVTDIAIAQGEPQKAVEALRYRYGDPESFRSKEIQQHVDSKRLEFLRQTDPDLWGRVERGRKVNDHTEDPIYYMDPTEDKITSNVHLLSQTLQKIGISQHLSSIQSTNNWPAQWMDIEDQPYLIHPPEVQYRRVEGVAMDRFLQDGEPRVSLVISACKPKKLQDNDGVLDHIVIAIGRDGELLRSMYNYWGDNSDQLIKGEQLLASEGAETTMYIGDRLQNVLIAHGNNKKVVTLGLDGYYIADMAVVDAAPAKALEAMSYFENEATFKNNS